MCGRSTQRLRELRLLKGELTELRQMIGDHGVAESDSPYCHYIEAAAARNGS